MCPPGHREGTGPGGGSLPGLNVATLRFHQRKSGVSQPRKPGVAESTEAAMAERVLRGPPGLGPEIPEVKTEMISPAQSRGSLPGRAVPHRSPLSVRRSPARSGFGRPLSAPHQRCLGTNAMKPTFWFLHCLLSSSASCLSYSRKNRSKRPGYTYCECSLV